jgi:hypothetical protein
LSAISSRRLVVSSSAAFASLVALVSASCACSASAVDRAGFQRLVADVGLGRAGIVLGLEVSRLARSSADLQRLLEFCSLSDTLIIDAAAIRPKTRTLLITFCSLKKNRCYPGQFPSQSSGQ